MTFYHETESNKMKISKTLFPVLLLFILFACENDQSKNYQSWIEEIKEVHIADRRTDRLEIKYY